MAYQEFAYFYDEFNGAADYDALFAYVTGELKAHGIQDGIVADFGCGTGELTLMLAQAGYDMIGIDVSEEMLSVLRDKADALGLPLTNPMLLCQDLLQLDLYGTIRAAVSTFDTYNHIGPLENFEKAIAKAAFFMEKDGVFVFDLNTPYKHEKVLSGQTFDFDEDDAACRWSNRYDPQTCHPHKEYPQTAFQTTSSSWQAFSSSPSPAASFFHQVGDVFTRFFREFNSTDSAYRRISGTSWTVYAASGAVANRASASASKPKRWIQT